MNNSPQLSPRENFRPRVFATILVTDNDSGVQMQIREEAFDEEKHTKVKDSKKPLRRRLVADDKDDAKPTPATETTDWSKSTDDDLETELRVRDLPVSGNRDAKIQRLTEDDAKSKE